MSRLLLLVLLVACQAEDPLAAGGSTDAHDSAGGTGADGGTEDSAGPADADGDGVPADADCDDANPAVHPGAAEICDGLDNDCDERVDPEDAWWPGAGAIRIPLRISATEGSPPGGIALLDLDLTALDLDPALLVTARVLRPGCASAVPDLDAQVEDALLGLLQPTPHESPLEDGKGTVALRWNLADALGPGDSRSAWLYLGGEPIPRPDTDLVATEDRLFDGEVELRFDATRGGLPSSLRKGEGPVLVDLASSGAGNGVWVGDWTSVPAHAPGTLQVRAGGPLLGVVESTGQNAGIGWRWTWTVLAGSGAVLLKTHLFAIDDVLLDHPGDWSNGLRPFQALQEGLGPLVTTIGDPPWDEVDVSTTGAGLLLAWLSAPDFRPYRPEVYGGNLILFGNDLSEATGGSRAVTTGEDLLAHRRLLLIPHDGDAVSAQALLPAWRAGLEASLGEPEQRPDVSE